MVSLSFRDLGGAGKPPLVVLHGLLGSSRNWLTAGAELAATRHVHALDLRNHGRSPHADDMSFAALTTDVLGWLDAQHLGAVELLGHSLGGKIAMRLACRHPERVSRLIIVDIAPKDYRWHAHRAEFAAMNELRLDALQSRGEAELRFESRVDDWAMRKFLATNLERTEDGRWRWTINLAALTRALPELEKNSLEEGDRFDGPVLFVIGGKSSYVQPEDRDLIARHFPRAVIETLPGCGHNPHMEARSKFVQLVQSGAVP